MNLAGLKVWVGHGDDAHIEGWATFVNVQKGRRLKLEDSVKDVRWDYCESDRWDFCESDHVSYHAGVVTFDGVMRNRGGPAFLSPCGSLYLLRDLLDDIKDAQEYDLDEDGTYWAAGYLCMAEQLLAERAL